MPHRWSNSAELRRSQIELDIDLTFNKVFRPLFVKKIVALAKYSILDVGAGTGHLSKALASEGCNVTAIEPSEGMFSVAKDVLEGTGVNLINCTSSDLPVDAYYGVAISHLVAHVVDDVSDFFRSIAAHLEIPGHLIFSIPHPCFFNDYKKIFYDGYHYMKSAYKEIAFTITRDPENEISGVPYHHRPLSTYVNTLVAAGFTIDGFEETWPSEEIQALYGKKWENPRYCLFVCKKY